MRYYKHRETAVKRMIFVLFTRFNSKISDNIWNDYLLQMPPDIQNRINRYVRWQDRQAALFGKILLLKGLKIYKDSSLSLDDLSYNQFGRPFINSDIDFNISHSGEYVVCAITDKGRLGIDIEKIRDIDFSDFRRYMTDDEWKRIKEADQPHEKFYEYWTIKESVMKAEGKGLSIPLTDILFDDKSAVFNKRIWFLNEIFFESGYKCFLASDLENSDIQIRKIILY